MQVISSGSIFEALKDVQGIRERIVFFVRGIVPYDDGLGVHLLFPIYDFRFRIVGDCRVDRRSARNDPPNDVAGKQGGRRRVGDG